VRDVNSYTLADWCASWRCAAELPDCAGHGGRARPVVGAAFAEADVVVITAGSSVSYAISRGRNQQAWPPGCWCMRGDSPGQADDPGALRGQAGVRTAGQPVSCINIFKVFVIPTIWNMLGARRRDSMSSARGCPQHPAGAASGLCTGAAGGAGRGAVGCAGVRQVEFDFHVDPSEAWLRWR